MLGLGACPHHLFCAHPRLDTWVLVLLAFPSPCSPHAACRLCQVLTVACDTSTPQFPHFYSNKFVRATHLSFSLTHLCLSIFHDSIPISTNTDFLQIFISFWHVIQSFKLKKKSLWPCKLFDGRTRACWGFCYCFGESGGSLFFFFGLVAACGILVLQPKIKPRSLTVKAPSPNHWTTREFSACSFLYSCK